MKTRISSMCRAGGAVASALLLGSLMAGPAAAARPALGTQGSVQSAVHQNQNGKRSPVRQATGELAVQLDPSSLQAVPISGGNRCQFTVNVVLHLTGTAVGAASGTTVAKIDAPCADALAMPPGTFSDTFKFTGGFEGTIDGFPSAARVTYAGVTRAGGAVSASLFLKDGPSMLACVQAQAGGRGTYSGLLLPGHHRAGR